MKRTWHLAFTACAILVAGFSAPAASAPAQDLPSAHGVLEGRVLAVRDGDSLRVQLDSGPVEVRMHAIDTPEHDQPGGRVARRALRQRLPAGTSVTLTPLEQDRYDRLVAVVHAGDVEINAWLVQEGRAWVYRRYTSERRYCELEQQAREGRRGLWRDPPARWVAPWDWRHRQHQPGFVPADRSNESLASCVAALRKAAGRRPAVTASGPPPAAR